MSNRRVLETMVELAPHEVLPKMFRGLSMQGVRPRFKIGNIWCHYDAEREVFYDEKGVQVSTGATFDKVHLTQILWDRPEATAGITEDTQAPAVQGQPAKV